MLNVKLPASISLQEGGVIAVGATPTPLMYANQARRGFLITNNGVKDCYWGSKPTLVDGTAANVNGGGLIGGYGDYLSSDMLSGYQGPVYAVCAAGLSTLIHVVEW